MSQDATPAREPSGEQELYADLLQLEDLESLLEELEESEEEGKPDELPPDLQERLSELGLSNADEVRARIAQVHATLDDAG